MAHPERAEPPNRDKHGTKHGATAAWAAQNGELYNHQELRKNLERDGHRFRSTCDTEVLPHLYERDGFDMPKALRGKFAFVAWDVEMRRGIVSRDRLGVKPLYYSRQGDLLIFASELKSLLASGLIPPELDPEAIESISRSATSPDPRRRSPTCSSSFQATVSLSRTKL